MDAELVVRAQNGDDRAFERLAMLVADRLHDVAYRILRDAEIAEDATQRALLTMWQRLPTLHDPTCFEAWTYRILVRICYEEAGRRSRWRDRLVPWPEREPRAPDTLTGIEDRDLFDHVFRRLSVEHRTVIVLHHYLGMTQEEIGAALGIAPGTAKSRLSRALERMRVILHAEAPPTRTASEEALR